MKMPGRYGSESNFKYRWNWNGAESDDEMFSQEGNSYDLGLRMFDARIARMKSRDPRADEYPWQSPYVYHGNSPIATIDYLGGGEPPKIGDKIDTKTNEYEFEDGSKIYDLEVSTVEQSFPHYVMRSDGTYDKQHVVKGKFENYSVYVDADGEETRTLKGSGNFRVQASKEGIVSNIVSNYVKSYTSFIPKDYTFGNALHDGYKGFDNGMNSFNTNFGFSLGVLESSISSLVSKKFSLNLTTHPILHEHVSLSSYMPKYNGLSKVGSSLGNVLTAVSVLSWGNDVFHFLNGDIGGGRMAFNTASTFTPMIIGLEFGAIPGAIVGAGFMFVDYMYSEGAEKTANYWKGVGQKTQQGFSDPYMWMRR